MWVRQRFVYEVCLAILTMENKVDKRVSWKLFVFIGFSDVNPLITDSRKVDKNLPQSNRPFISRKVC